MRYPAFIYFSRLNLALATLFIVYGTLFGGWSWLFVPYIGLTAGIHLFAHWAHRKIEDSKGCNGT